MSLTTIMRNIMHIDFNSYFASVEQQANPHLRGKPIGVTGGDKQSLRLPDGSLRIKRTVLGAASIEAKKFGVKTGMQIWEAKRLCPQIIIVPGNSDKYLTVTTKFINILKDYTPYLEVFSIDECFLQLVGGSSPIIIAQIIKRRIRDEIGKFIKCSVGISYNKLMAKLAGSLQKPDGLVVIENEKKAMEVLDKIPLDEICGIGFRIKRRLNNMGIFNFKSLRGVPLDILLLEFKSYGNFLYNASRGIDHTEVIPFFEKEEVAQIKVGESLVGTCGILNDQIIDYFNLEGQVAACEINLSIIYQLPTFQLSYKPVPKYSAVIEDISAIFNQKTLLAEIIAQVKKAGSPLVKKVDVIDIFKDEKIGKDKKSVTLRLTYQRSDRTPTQEEVIIVREKIIDAVTHQFSAILIGSR